MLSKSHTTIQDAIYFVDAPFPAPPPQHHHHHHKQTHTASSLYMSVLNTLSAGPGNQFPAGEIHRWLRQARFASRVSSDAPFYLGAVLEYVSAEVLDHAGNIAQKRISASHLQTAVGGDEELNKLLGGVKISSRSRVSQWSSYIYNTLKKVHPRIGLEPSAMKTMNQFVHDVLWRLATEASREAKANRTPTLSTTFCRTAVGRVLPDNLGKNADVLASARAAKYTPKL